MKKNMMILAFLMIISFLSLGAASAATTGTIPVNKISSTPLPDLSVSAVSLPAKGVRGCNITVSDTIRNKGNIAAGGFWVNYYLKTNSTSQNIYIGNRYINGLLPGSTNHKSTVIDVPTNLLAGKYYLRIQADAHKNVTESNKTNNYRYSTTRIQIIGPRYIIFDEKVGGDVTKNPEINSLIPKTSFSSTIFRLENYGSLMLKFGNGNGPKVLISAGVHGNEPEANIAVMKYLEYIKDKTFNGTLYVIPFDIPCDTALNTRYYNGEDPNRIANISSTPGWNIVHFASENGVKYFLDVHSGGSVESNGLLNVNPGNSSSDEYKWAHYISTVSGCISRVQPLEAGMIRAETFKYGINTITLEVERDSIPTAEAAETEFKMINAATRFFKFPYMN